MFIVFLKYDRNVLITIRTEAVVVLTIASVYSILYQNDKLANDP